MQPAHISQAYAKALTRGRRDGSGGLEVAAKLLALADEVIE